MSGSHLPHSKTRLQRSSLTAVVGEATAVPDDSVEEHMTIMEQSDPTAMHESPNSKGKDAVETLDGHKMIRVCDKLIDVFMVDKPTPTDWRRLLAFSKEWNIIRPHFYKRCEERADTEDNPGMKHKLLRLRRKLKEVSFFRWLANLDV